MSRIEQSGRMSLRRLKPPIKGGSAPEEKEDYNVPRDRVVILWNGLNWLMMESACIF